MNRAEFLRHSTSFACVSGATIGPGACAETAVEIEPDSAAKLKRTWTCRRGRFNGITVSPANFLHALRSFYLAALLLVCTSCSLALDHSSAAPRTPVVHGPYFGQPSPGKTPQIFAPGILSLPDRLEDQVAFSPDGNECYFSVWGAKYSTPKIYWTKCLNDIWTPQVEAPFSAGHRANGPVFSADGNKLYFRRGEPDPGVWVVRRTAQGWSDPKRLAAQIDSPYRDSPCSETADGTAYFASDRPGGQGVANRLDLWRTRQVPGQPLEVENLGATVNSVAADFGPSVARSGSYLIFTSERAGGVGRADLYVSFPDGPDGWTAPVNLNNYCPGINLAGQANVGASLSPDERYLFFTRYSRTAAGEQEDVYWVENPIPEPARRGFPTLKGAYLGPNPSAKEAEVFAPGNASIPREEGGFAERPVFSPDFRECFFDLANFKTKTFTSASMRCENGVWSKSEPAFFTRYVGHTGGVHGIFLAASDAMRRNP